MAPWALCVNPGLEFFFPTDSPTRTYFCRLQANNQRSQGVSARPAAAAAEQQPGGDLDSGGEVPRDLDRNRCHIPDIPARQGQWK